MDERAPSVAPISSELARAREERQAVRQVLRAVARGEGLQPVLEEIVEAAKRLCHGEHAQLYLADGDVFRIAAQRSAETHDLKAAYDYAEHHPHARDRTTIVGRVAMSAQAEQIPDVREDADYAYEGQEIVGFLALLGVPIVFEEELIGVIAVGRDAAGRFADEHVELVQDFADEAAIAIANTRLIEAVEQQLEQQRAVADVLQALARSEQLESVFEGVVDAAKRLCRAEFGALFLVEGNAFRFATGHKGEAELEEHDRANPHPFDLRTALGRVGLTRDLVHIPDVQADPEYQWGGQAVAEYRTVLAAPIIVEGELIGGLDVTRREVEPFSDGEISLLRTFADQAAIAIANARLIDAVERQRTELSRFVSPQVAELVSSDEGERMLSGHRAYISCLFCDLRGFTAFAETAAPEELIEVLGQYHEAIGELIPAYDGTLEHYAGDGLMVFFNDPLPVEAHELQAIRMALAAQERFAALASGWRKRGTELGLGIGIAAGYATLGRIGFKSRYDYGALGPVTNLASRLSTSAAAGQTLIGQRVYAAVEDSVEAEPVGELELKGFGRAVVAYAVGRLTA